MADFWTPVLQAVLAAILASIVLTVGAIVVKRSKRQADRTGLTVRLLNIVRNNWAYVRSAFRWKAVLFVDHATSKANVVFYKRAAQSDTDQRQIVRVRDYTSRHFQRKESFAWQVYRATVDWCAANGWATIEFIGYTPPGYPMYPGQTYWTVKLANANNQMCVVIGRGWCPILPPRDDQMSDRSILHRLEMMVPHE